jgi:hypothetical protein
LSFDANGPAATLVPWDISMLIRLTAVSVEKTLIRASIVGAPREKDGH